MAVSVCVCVLFVCLFVRTGKNRSLFRPNCLIINDSLGYIFHILDDDFSKYFAGDGCWSWHLRWLFIWPENVFCLLFPRCCRLYCRVCRHRALLFHFHLARCYYHCDYPDRRTTELHCIAWLCLWVSQPASQPMSRLLSEMRWAMDQRKEKTKKTNDSNEIRFLFVWVWETTSSKRRRGDEPF